MPQSARVAVIDDESAVRRALERLLRVSGYEAMSFPSAEAYLEETDREPPDCILLDLQMPQMSGVEFLRRINELANPPPIIIVTATADDELRALCRQYGASGWLQKPVEREALLACISATLAA